VERGSARSMSVPSRRRDERSFSLGAMTLPIRRRGERSSSQSSCRDSKPSTSALTEPCFAISETEAWLQEDRARQETATSLSRQSSSSSFSNSFEASGLDDVGDLHSVSSDTAVMNGHLQGSVSIVPQPRDERAARPSFFGKKLAGLKNAALSAVRSTSHRRRGRAATQPADARARPSCAQLRVATRPACVYAWEVPGEHSNASSSTAAFVVGHTGQRSPDTSNESKEASSSLSDCTNYAQAWANGW